MKLEIQHLAFSYIHGQDVFSDMSFSMETGGLLCLLGPNGCGKTTLLSNIAGLLKSNAGEVLIDGESFNSMTASRRAQLVGYVPQNIVASFDYTVLDYVVTGCAPHMKLLDRPKEREYQRARDVLEMMGISHLENKSYARISGGERQQISIARVIVQRPSFILLDEPTAHLDFGNSIRLLQLVKQLQGDGFGVMMTTHNPDQVLMLDSDVVVMKRGGDYITGHADDLTESMLSDIYGVDIVLDFSEKSKRGICIARGLE